MAKKTRIVKCLKCKKEFETELDSNGIPYKRICYNCKRNSKNYNTTFAARASGI